MQRTTTTALTLFIVALLLIAALPSALAQDGGDLPDVIMAARPGFHPEGIEWDAEAGHFLTGSLTEGTIFAIDDDGTVTPFIEDADLVSSIGIHIDTATNRLLVANSSLAALSGGEGFAKLGAYDLATGERLFMADLGALLPDFNHFANDVTVDADGNAYVTDSLAPAIYKVDVDGNAEVFLQDDALTDPNFGLNGIDFHPDGFLLVALAGNGSLLRVPLDDPSALEPVALPEPVGIDGMVLDAHGDLFAVGTLFDAEGNGDATAVFLTSDDGWQSAIIFDRVDLDDTISPTTIAVRDSAGYVVHAYFNSMGAADPVQEFEMRRVDFMMGGMDDMGDMDSMDSMGDDAGGDMGSSTGGDDEDKPNSLY